jgi:hypothetical protein
MKKQAICIFIISLFLNNLLCIGQNAPDSALTVKIETNDGNVFVGLIVDEDSLSIVIKTDYLGEIKIPKNYLKTKTELSKAVKVGKEFWLPNPQSSRYFWAPMVTDWERDQRITRISGFYTTNFLMDYLIIFQ